VLVQKNVPTIGYKLKGSAVALHQPDSFGTFLSNHYIGLPLRDIANFLFALR